MRFDDLLGDLAAELGAQHHRELWDEAQELARAERATRTLAQSLGERPSWSLGLLGGHLCSGVLLRLGPDWVLQQGGDGEWLVPVSAIRRATPLAQRPDQGQLGLSGSTVSRAAEADSSPLRSVVRRLSRDREQVRLLLDDGSALSARLLGCGVDAVQLATEDGPSWLPFVGLSAVVRASASGS